MDEPDHPAWCSPRRCTATAAPFNGAQVGTHRSAPEASGITEVYVVQSPEGPLAVELSRAGRTLTMSKTEAGSLGAAMEDLFVRTGLNS